MKYSFSQKSRGRGGYSRGVRALGPKGNKNSKYIDPNKFINKAETPEEAVPYEAAHTFTDFAFDAKIQANLDAKSYVVPSPIQDQAIPEILKGRDVIGLANTGTGKTAAFLLPIIQGHLNNSKLGPALIMAPTRELAHQIKDECVAFTKGTQIRSAVCVGGQNMYAQIQQLKRNPQIIIGTPGRLKDLMNQGKLHVDDVSVLVLDEVDRMLDMGFIHDMRAIIGLTPANRQSLFFSATMTKEISALAQTFLTGPITISVVVSETSNHVDQDVIYVANQDDKSLHLAGLLARDEFQKVIVFGETKWGVQKLARRLEQAGLKVAAIHGDKTQGQRLRALKDFKEDRVQTLVATDVAARGLDIPLVSHVINYDIPQTYEDYTHRIGRTGRAGNMGAALTFVISGDPIALAKTEARYPLDRQALPAMAEHKPFAEALAVGHEQRSASPRGGRDGFRRQEGAKPGYGKRPSGGSSQRPDKASAKKALSLDGEFEKIQRRPFGKKRK